MEEIYIEIREWLLTQPDWLQEAAERLLKQGALGAGDLNSLCSLIKTPDGRKASNRRRFDELLAAPPKQGDLRISAVGEISGIENLTPRQPMTLGDGNLVVVYGHNGSGKSGYTRILKKASGKPRANSLKPNVFGPLPATQKCQISYELAGQKNVVEWDANGEEIGALRAMDIFDSDEATHYLRNENAASYTPPVVGMFEALAGACDQIKALLQNEQNLLVRSLPVAPPAYSLTEPIQRYGTLSHEISVADLDRMLQWTEEDTQKLQDITERLKVADPTALAKQRRSTKEQVDQIISGLQRCVESYSETNLASIRELQATAANKRRIATEAAQVASAKLDGVGGDTWRAMWEAARAYSQTAYPVAAFPVTDGARCILCHQELDPEARQRLNDFEAFVQGKLEGEAKAAEANYKQAVNSLPEIPTQGQIDTQCEAAGLGTDNWKQFLASFWQSVSLARYAILSGEAQGPAQAVRDVSEAQQNLISYAGQLDAQAIQFGKDAAGFDRAQAAKLKISLEAKHWVTQQSEAVRKEVDRLWHYKEYENWKSLANSRVVSTKAGAIAEKVITQAYVQRFNKELKLLGAGRIKVELVKTKAEKGRVLHRIQLKAAQHRQSIELVLSEGERRIISLAAFLADVTEKPYSAPFVFDDPISSLDHDFEWNVACRLAELAKDRQVLVLTHRLSFYGAMDDAAKKIGDEWRKLHLTQLCIEVYSGTAGHSVAQATWNSKTTAANNILFERLAAAKRAGDAAGGEAYRALAQGICSDFRKLLERTVEDDLLNEVVKRHRRSVTTDNRLGALHLIQPDDCQFIDGLMTKYSCYEHSQSQEVPVFIPEEVELRSDLESLKQWRKKFLERRAFK